MTTKAHEITTSTLRQAMPEDAARILAQQVVEHRLETHEALWNEGEDAAQLAIVAAGRLAVVVDGQPVGRIEPGQTVGERALLRVPSPHNATLRAMEPSHVLLLDGELLQHFRRAEPAAHARLLEQAARSVAHRMRAANVWHARLSERPHHGRQWRGLQALREAWRRRTSRGVRGVPRPLHELLAELPVLDTAPPEVTERLLEAFEARPVKVGTRVVREGRPGDTVSVLAEGTLHVQRAPDSRPPRDLTTLEPSAFCGLDGFVSGLPHSATCVAATEAWVYTLNRDALRRLDSYAQALWHEVALHELSRVILRADRRIVRARRSVFEPEHRDEASPRPDRRQGVS